jgi:hypothetical protein
VGSSGWGGGPWRKGGSFYEQCAVTSLALSTLFGMHYCISLFASPN